MDWTSSCSGRPASGASAITPSNDEAVIEADRAFTHGGAASDSQRVERQLWVEIGRGGSGWKAAARPVVLSVRSVTPSAAFAIILMLDGCNLTPLPQVARFPVKDEARAISIAKYVCRREAGPEFQWEAHWIAESGVWDVNTMPSIHKSGDPLWSVEIPVFGPLPTRCRANLYDIITPSGAMSSGG